MTGHYGSIPLREFREFIRIVRRLRKDCPWDRKQTHRSLRDSLIEETYEVVEAIDRKKLHHLKGELGDLLLNIALHTTISEEAGEFTLRNVLSEISAKLIRRHPHVFGSVKAATAEDVKRTWEIVKRAEGRKSVLEGVPGHLPALQRAQKLQQRASKVGFDWDRADDAWEKVREEVEELRTSLLRAHRRKREEEFGDLLFALVNYARFIGINPEHALRATNRKFTQRFRYIEKVLRKRGKQPHESTLAEMDALWNQAKRRKRRTLRH
jgi:tetrapyrrole methylase family protein / MazG family protein